MKLIYLAFLIPFLLSCNSSRTASNNSRQFSPEISCPESGNCTFEVLKNSQLRLKKDEFGKLYPEIISGNKIVLKYHFKKHEVKNTADSNYSEFIYLEIDKNIDQLILTNIELEKVKLTFGRICFCRGSMGYFKVTQGKLFLFNNNGKLNINLKFEVNKIPHIITEISETINY